MRSPGPIWRLQAVGESRRPSRRGWRGRSPGPGRDQGRVEAPGSSSPATVWVGRERSGRGARDGSRAARERSGGGHGNGRVGAHGSHGSGPAGARPSWIIAPSRATSNGQRADRRRLP